MKLKIVSDGLCNSHGSGCGTRIETEDGKQIEGVISIDWHADTDRYLTTCEIRLIGVKIEAAVEAGAITCVCGDALEKELICRSRLRRSIDAVYGVNERPKANGKRKKADVNG